MRRYTTTSSPSSCSWLGNRLFVVLELFDHFQESGQRSFAGKLRDHSPFFLWKQSQKDPANDRSPAGDGQQRQSNWSPDHERPTGRRPETSADKQSCDVLHRIQSPHGGRPDSRTMVGNDPLPVRFVRVGQLRRPRDNFHSPFRIKSVKGSRFLQRGEDIFENVDQTHGTGPIRPESHGPILIEHERASSSYWRAMPDEEAAKDHYEPSALHGLQRTPFLTSADPSEWVPPVEPGLRVEDSESRSSRGDRPHKKDRPAAFPVPRRSAPRHLADLKNALLYLVLRILRAVQLSNRICQTTVKIRSANWAARVRHFCQRTPPIGPQHPVRWIQFGRRSGPCSRLERMGSSSKTENPAAVDDSVGVRRPSDLPFI